MQHVLERAVRVASRIIRTGRLRTKAPFSVKTALQKYFDGKQAIIVQIGAHTGVSNDHLNKLLLRNGKRWSAILVEPVPFLFQQLKSNYSRTPGVTVVDRAIGETSGEMTFYYIDPTAAAGGELPNWSDQLGSFSREHITKHGAELDKHILAMPVRSSRLMDFLSEYGALGVDALIVDAEGHDYEIVTQLDFARATPRIIVYEHKHMPEVKQALLSSMLRGHGYTVVPQVEDTICLRELG
jgi:FkbM family methyltransferase